MTSTNTSARTFAKALPVAETVTIDELEALLNESKSVTVLKPRRSPIHAYVFAASRYGTNNDRMIVAYEYCTRNGYGATGSATTFVDCPVFDFYNLGRLVTTESVR